MQFTVGTTIVHPIYGVGNIIKVEEKRFSEIKASLYYEIALLRSTIWVPVKAQAAIGLRLVTPKSDLEQYRELLKSPPSPPPSNDKPQVGRHMELAKLLKEGSFQVMCEVVRDLTLAGRQKPLGRSDATTLQKTRDRLLQEWAVSAEISETEAAEEINALLLTQETASNEK